MSAAGFIDIQIVGDTVGVQAMLLHLEAKLYPPNLAYFLGVEVDPYLRNRAEARFQDEGDDVVGKWEPLHPATINIRQQQGYGSGPINRRTGELENYITSVGDVTPHPAGATLTLPGAPASGELAEKVQTAQIGKDYPATVPRPVLGMNETDLAAVLTMLALEIERQ